MHHHHYHWEPGLCWCEIFTDQMPFHYYCWLLFNWIIFSRDYSREGWVLYWEPGLCWCETFTDQMHFLLSNQLCQTENCTGTQIYPQQIYPCTVCAQLDIGLLVVII